MAMRRKRITEEEKMKKKQVLYTSNIKPKKISSLALIILSSSKSYSISRHAQTWKASPSATRVTSSRRPLVRSVLSPHNNVVVCDGDSKWTVFRGRSCRPHSRTLVIFHVLISGYHNICQFLSTSLQIQTNWHLNQPLTDFSLWQIFNKPFCQASKPNDFILHDMQYKSITTQLVFNTVTTCPPHASSSTCTVNICRNHSYQLIAWNKAVGILCR